MPQPTPDTFREEYAEFRLLSDEVVQAKLDAAYRRVGPEMFGDLRDDAAKLLAAHLLAVSPLGEPSTRSVKKEGARTTYLDEFDRIVQEVRPFGAAVGGFGSLPPSPGD
jgi:hypothetical protein